MSLLPPVVTELQANAREFFHTLDEAEHRMHKLGDEGASTGEKMRQRLGGGMQAAGAAVTAAGGVLFEMGEKLEQQHVALEQAVKNTGESYEEYAGKINGAVKSGEHYGHNAADTEKALTVLTRATNNTGTSLKDMTLVTELAAAKHISLADAASVVAKMHAGAYRPLKEFGINLKDNATAVAALKKAQDEANKTDDARAIAIRKLQDLQEIQHSKAKLTVADHVALRNAQMAVTDAEARNETAQKALTAAQKDGAKAVDFTAASHMILAKIHGTAEAQADTFGGRIKALRTHFEDYASVIGQKVGPAMTLAGPLMMGVGTIIQSGVVPMVAKAVTSFASMAAGAVASFAAQVAAAATWAAGMVASAAVAMAPFLPWIALIAAVGIAAYELYKHWDTVWSGIKAAVGAAWQAIMFVVHVGIDAVKAYIDAYLTVLRVTWETVWGAVKATVTAVWDVVKTVVGGGVAFVKGLFDREVNGLRAIWDGVWHGVQSTVEAVWGGIKAAVKGGINEIIGAIDFFIRAINKMQIHIPSVGVGPFHTPGFDWNGLNLKEIPKLATGGIVTSPTLALVGEAGPEAVIPLSQYNAAGGGSSFDGLAAVKNQASQIVALSAFTFGSMLVLAGDFHDRMPPVLLDAFRTIIAGITDAVNVAADDVGKGTQSMTSAAQQFAQAAEQAAQQVASAMSQLQQQQQGSSTSSSPSGGGGGGSLPDASSFGSGGIFVGSDGAYQVGADGTWGKLYDDGGMLPPGVTMAVNKTGKPEHIFTDDQVGRMGGVVIEEGAVQVYITGAGVLTVDDVQDAIDRAFIGLVRELRSR